ncbi:MAG: hypothetical protein PF795_14355, partial [Kiritimatiellae bacterium]|nr:hypothetical protein [Kiritimatiellia bacterium]
MPKSTLLEVMPDSTSRHQRNRTRTSGSALLVTLIVVSLLMVTVLAFVVLIRMEMREVGNYEQQVLARSNARLGMELALAQLQETAGPDRRVTGTGTLLDTDVDTPEIEGVAHPKWTGVWRKQNDDSRTHDPEFLRWLVSLSPGEAENESTALAMVDADRSIELVGEGTVLNTEQVVRAEKIDIHSPGPGNASGRYAYVVLDEGVKVSVGLNDPYLNGNAIQRRWSQAIAQAQAAELLPGFSASENGESVLRDFSDVLAKVPGWNSLELLHNSFRDGARLEFHDATLMSMGVQSDTAQGGLKTDLSTAFEMSDAEFHGLSTFTDSGERNRSYSGGWGQGFDLGYLYAFQSRSAGDTRPANMSNPAPADWSSSNFKIRGPTWNVLRNYYRLYQERDSLSAGQAISSRPFSPSRFDGMPRNETSLLTFLSTTSHDMRNRNSLTNHYVFGSVNQSARVQRITESSLAPVATRVLHVFSLAREQDPDEPASGNLRLVINTVVVLHNPYDVPVDFRGFKVAFDQFPFNRISLKRRNDPLHGDTDVEITNMYNWLRMLTNAQAQPWVSYNVIATNNGSDSPAQRHLLRPGEIKVFSNEGDPLNYGTDTTQGIGVPSGPAYEEDSGVFFSRFGESGNVQSFKLSDTGRIWIEMDLKGGWGIHTFLTPDDLGTSSDSWGRSHADDAPLQRIVLPVGTLASTGSRVVCSLADDYYTGAELGVSLDDRVPFFVMDARLKPLTDDAAVLTTFNPRSMISQGRFMNGEPDHWEGRLYEINSFNEIDLDLEIFSGRNNGYWGPSHSAGAGLTHLPLFQVPYGPMLSLAELAHVEVGNFLHDPPFAIGNSLAHPLIPRDHVYHYIERDNNQSFSVVDQSFMNNESLWDGFYFSTLAPQRDPGLTRDQVAQAFRDGDAPLPNSRFLYQPAAATPSVQLEEDFEDPQRVAAHLLTRGAFNVNSTSVSAWIAILSGLRQHEIEMEDGTIETVPGSFFSRFVYPLGDSDDLYRGFVELTDGEIEGLALEIVTEVKTRGPFLS